MEISTKGRYSILIMLDLAEIWDTGKFLSLRDISEKEGISLKYLEKIMLNFKNTDYFISARGEGGGYKLRYSPDKYSIGEILRIAEGGMDVVKCISISCPKKTECKTYKLWKELNDTISNFLDSKTLKDYM